MCHSGMGNVNPESEEVLFDSSRFVSSVTITPLSWVTLTPASRRMESSKQLITLKHHVL